MSTIIDRIAEEARREPEQVLPVLHALLGEHVEIAESLRPVAAMVGDERFAGAISEFQRAALTTSQAQQRLGVSTPQALHQLRRRGRLLGGTIGNRTYWPAWQFADEGFRDDLAEIHDAINRFTSDVVAADRIMRLPREELGGLSIAETRGDPDHVAEARRLLNGIGGGF